jgi:hypothetical protein
MIVTASVILARSFSKLAERGGTKTLSLTYPHTEKFRGVKSGDFGGQAIVPPRPIQANTVQLTQKVNSQWKCGGVPHLVEKLNLSPYLALSVERSSFQVCPDN